MRKKILKWKVYNTYTRVHTMCMRKKKSKMKNEKYIAHMHLCVGELD